MNPMKKRRHSANQSHLSCAPSVPTPTFTPTASHRIAVGGAPALRALSSAGESLDAAQTLGAYLVTADGCLLALRPTGASVSKWARLKAPHATCVASCRTMVACGCPNGVVRLFKANSLEYKVMMQRDFTGWWESPTSTTADRSPSAHLPPYQPE